MSAETVSVSDDLTTSNNSSIKVSNDSSSSTSTTSYSTSYSTSESTTGSNISSIETASRSVTPKEVCCNYNYFLIKFKDSKKFLRYIYCKKERDFNSKFY